jgi:hypothetical protein
LLDLIYANICGPIMIHAIDGYTCFIIDDHIGYEHVYLMKVWIIWRFKESINDVEKKTRKSINILSSDRGAEYFNMDFQDYLNENEILS